MRAGVWGSVKDWGLADHSDDSAVVSIDPVCGMKVDEARAAGKASYGGVHYFFCSKECQKDFEEEPGGFMGRPHGPARRVVDINVATAEDLRGVLQVDTKGLNRILRHRPYHSWDEFRSKNPGFSEPMLKGLRRSGVIISTPDLNRMV